MSSTAVLPTGLSSFAFRIGRQLRSAPIGVSVQVLVALGWVGVLAALYSRLVQERMPDGTLRRAKHRFRGRRPIALVLSAEEFRDDPKILAAEGSIRVLELHSSLQGMLLFRFYPKDAIWPEVVGSKYRRDFSAERGRLREFHSRFLLRLYRLMGVDLVIGPHIHFANDVDWGAASEALGVPYIVLHRENLLASVGIRRSVRERVRLVGARFEGRHIIVHNEKIRRLFIQTGYCADRQISAPGCMRMDALVHRVMDGDRISDLPRVVMFPYIVGNHQRLEFRLLKSALDRLNVFLARFALDHPEVEMVMKPKLKWADRNEQFEPALQAAGLNAAEIPNFTVRSDLDVHDLVFSSSVMIGVNTTTLIEAALAGCRAIIPYLEEMHDPHINDFPYFHDDFPSLLVARSLEELEEEIFKGLSGEPLPDTTLAAYRALFEDYVSTLDARATERTVALLSSVTGSGASASAPAQHVEMGAGGTRQLETEV